MPAWSGSAQRLQRTRSDWRRRSGRRPSDNTGPSVRQGHDTCPGHWTQQCCGTFRSLCGCEEKLSFSGHSSLRRRRLRRMESKYGSAVPISKAVAIWGDSNWSAPRLSKKLNQAKQLLRHVICSTFSLL